MDLINRSAVIVMPAEPFLKWLHRADSTSTGLTLEDLRREPTIYLLPTCDSEEEALGHLEQVCSEIFEEQLDYWLHIPSSWPVHPVSSSDPPGVISTAAYLPSSDG